VSIRRACAALEVDTSTYHYKARRPDQAALKGRIQEICATRVRYGYRRVHVLLRREGWTVNHKKTRRIYSELGLQLREPRRPSAGSKRSPTTTEHRPHGRTMSGPWTSFTTSSLPGARSGY
jgi:putative transposase